MLIYPLKDDEIFRGICVRGMGQLLYDASVLNSDDYLAVILDLAAYSVCAIDPSDHVMCWLCKYDDQMQWLSSEHFRRTLDV